MDKFPKQNDTKKKSRRHRRRPKNLLAEYTRRQRQHIWLETHIWHAKRMKMVDAWGYRLAEHPNDKGFRAVHRAVTNSCTIQVGLMFTKQCSFDTEQNWVWCKAVFINFALYSQTVYMCTNQYSKYIYLKFY